MSIITPVEEQQGRGWMADETEAGRIRVSMIDSDVAYMPLVAAYGTSINAGVSGSYTDALGNTYTSAQATASSQYASEGNPFGSLSGVLVNVPRGSIGGNEKQVTLLWNFFGKKLVLYWDLYRNSNPLPIQGWVDGKYFTLDNTIRDSMSGALGTSNAGAIFQCGREVPVALKDDGVHQCKLYFPMDLTSTTTAQWLIFGYGVERRLGAYDIGESYISRPFPVAVSSAVTTLGTIGAFGYPVRGFKVVNTTSGTANVYWTRDGVQMPTITLAAGASYEEDFKVPIKLNRTTGVGNGQMTLSTDTASSGAIGGTPGAGVWCWLYQRSR